MKFILTELLITFKRQTVAIPFDHVTYFWGQMGAGKSSIAKMIDYCLGGNVELSPAMQSEFVAARLTLEFAQGPTAIERQRDSQSVFVEWTSGGDTAQCLLPARAADGEVIPQTGVENLSDFIFWRSDIVPPKVRTSKTKADSGSARLSMRDLLWYCYLDQDDIDSSFFHLQQGADTFKQLKSRDVVRYVIGYHDERVAEIEAYLDRLRGERLATSATIDSLRRALKEMGIESELEIAARRDQLQADAAALTTQIALLRRNPEKSVETGHAADRLRTEAIGLSTRLASVEQALADLAREMDQDQRHLNEIETLSLKFRRSSSARAILGGVSFHTCPRCVQLLPTRGEFECQVCGQVDQVDRAGDPDAAIIEQDIKARSDELRDIIKRHEAAKAKLVGEGRELQTLKRRVESERNVLMAQYDSAYLSNVLLLEREHASLVQQLENLDSLTRLTRLLDDQVDALAKIQASEAKQRTNLKEAKQAAESDETNLASLKSLFLDCLVRSGVPGITKQDTVEIKKTDFYPTIVGSNVSDGTIVSFTTLSSGGKKTLFKCCFAVAFHRLASRIQATLPQLLIIDSPMKNISERENREQFEKFYKLLYELSVDELSDTQLVIIDKEFADPRNVVNRMISRHMKPDDPENPPLIPYYRGK